ncbi:hypothetical protein FHS20_003812 [Phyllobacterium endophyticum]|nr:hypothetical protein [Phyllobacterium endophyticum]
MDQSKINRRGFLGTVGAAATGLALAVPATVHAQDTNSKSTGSGSNPDVLTRALPRTGEKVTALGLGTFLTFDKMPGDRRDDLRQVFDRYVAAGGRVVDTSPLYGSAEVSVGQFMGELPGSDELFLPTRCGRRENISAMKATRRRASGSRDCAPGGKRSTSCSATASPMRLSSSR